MTNSYEVAVWTSLGIGAFTVLGIIGVLDAWGVFEDPYFSFSNAKFLDFELSKNETWMLAIFFFLHSFVMQLLHVLVMPIYSKRIINGFSDYDTLQTRTSSEVRKQTFSVQERPLTIAMLFVVYDLQRSAGVFFAFLGVVSNFSFLIASLIGTLAGGVLSRPLFLIFHWDWMYDPGTKVDKSATELTGLLRPGLS